jgi:hypothetical protein
MWRVSLVSVQDSTRTSLAAARPSTIKKKLYNADNLGEHEW